MKYKREHKGIEASSELVSVVGHNGKIRTVYIVRKKGLPDYRSSAALTHQEAVKDAVNYWLKTGALSIELMNNDNP